MICPSCENDKRLRDFCSVCFGTGDVAEMDGPLNPEHADCEPCQIAADFPGQTCYIHKPNETEKPHA